LRVEEGEVSDGFGEGDKAEFDLMEMHYFTIEK
jgi:hypothetical protein